MDFNESIKSNIAKHNIDCHIGDISISSSDNESYIGEKNRIYKKFFNVSVGIDGNKYSSEKMCDVDASGNAKPSISQVKRITDDILKQYQNKE